MMKEQIAAARAYEELFVRALFHQWTPIVMDAARIQSGSAVLDVACGTGVLAREAARRVGPSGRVCGVDVAPGMLEVARGIAPDIEWKEAGADALPYPDESFDAVASQFGLMFFANRPGSLQEMLRVLRPGGTLAVAVWDSLDQMPAFRDEVMLFERCAGPAAAAALRAPFNLGNRSDLLQLVGEAGIADAEITTHEGTARFPNIQVLVEADLRGWLPVMGVVLEEPIIQETLNQSDKALRDHVTDDGEAVFIISAHIIRAKKGG